MEFGTKIDFFRELEQRGKKTPLRDRQPLQVDEQWMLDAYQRLSRSRQYGMNGPQPLALSEVVTYWRRVGRIGELEEFISFMQALDGVFLDVANERSKARQQQHG